MQHTTRGSAAQAYWLMHVRCVGGDIMHCPSVFAIVYGGPYSAVCRILRWSGLDVVASLDTSYY